MSQFFLKILAFLLGIKHQSPEELEAGGRKLRLEILLRKLRTRISPGELESIWLIGAVEFSESKVKEIEILHKQGHRFDFKIPTTFDFKGDYIDFYQISTRDKHYYILAMSDTFALSKEDDVISFFHIDAPYPTSHLPYKNRDYPPTISIENSDNGK